MPITGHIQNARATRATQSAPAAGVIRRAPTDFAGLDAALNEMREAGVDRLAIEGGDGTVREVLSRAFEVWPDARPDFAILPSGNTNLIARKVGGARGPDAAARIAAAAAPRRMTLPVLRADRAGARTLRGFILGAGAYETVTRIAQQEIAARHGAQVIAAVLRLLSARALRAGAPIGVDGAPPKPRMLTAMTTLPGKLLYRFEPFWDDGDGPIRWLDIDAHPPRLMLAAPFVAFGAPRRWMRRAYRSGAAATVELALETDFVMDGECFSPGEDGVLRVSAAETATFLSL